MSRPIPRNKVNHAAPMDRVFDSQLNGSLKRLAANGDEKCGPGKNTKENDVSDDIEESSENDETDD